MLTQKIEHLLNQALMLDPDCFQQLCSHADRTVKIEIQDFQKAWLIEIVDEGIRFGSADDRVVDVTISGRAASLAGLLFSRKASSAFPRDISIRGDVHLAQDLQAIVKGLDIDWEEYASRWIGDTTAHKFGNLVRANLRWLAEVRSTMSDNTSEYLRFEIELLPDRLLVNEFNNSVDTLRDDTERLQQRIIRIMNRIDQESA